MQNACRELGAAACLFQEHKERGSINRSRHSPQIRRTVTRAYRSTIQKNKSARRMLKRARKDNGARIVALRSCIGKNPIATNDQIKGL